MASTLEGGEEMTEVKGPGPDGNAGDTWNEVANADDEGRDDRTAGLRS